MKYLKLFEYAKNESLVDKKIKIIKDLSYDLTDDGFTVDIYKNAWDVYDFDRAQFNSYILTCARDDNKHIFVMVTYKKYSCYIYRGGKALFNKIVKEPTISTDYFNKKVEEFIEDLKSYNLKVIGEGHNGDWYSLIQIYKYGKTSDFIRNY